MGTVYLVGAGPGAPDLLTLRAARLLEQADIVLYDALVHPEVVALAKRAKRLPVGKRGGRVSIDQRFINRLLVESALHHEVVVRLKGGDPMLFARAREEIDALEQAGIRFEIVPGVTAALAAAADLKTPLTERGIARKVTLATQRVGAKQASNSVRYEPGETLVLYMAAGDAQAVAAELLAQGFSARTPIVLVENASLPTARHSRGCLEDLMRLASAHAAGPTLLCVGEVFRATEALGADRQLPRPKTAP